MIEYAPIPELEKEEVIVSASIASFWSKLKDYGYSEDKFSSRIIEIIENTTNITLSY